MEAVFFDFDGVILDSMPIRDLGFREIFSKYDDHLVDQLIDYHRINGGLSRFHKIRYFFNELLKEDISEDEVDRFADEFSFVMRQHLPDPALLLPDTIDFIRGLDSAIDKYVVSGSEDKELNWLCSKLKINNYFVSIHGSPTPKNKLVNQLLLDGAYNPASCALIGDSINDFEAAEDNGIIFYGFNNKSLINITSNYINDYGADFP